MSMEFIAIISVSIGLAGLILNGQRNLRADMQAQREEMQAQREEMQAEFKAVREEMQTEFKAVREEIVSLRERMAHLEGLLEGLREAITGRHLAVAEDPNRYDPR